VRWSGLDLRVRPSDRSRRPRSRRLVRTAAPHLAWTPQELKSPEPVRVRTSHFSSLGMELNGALSNPFVTDKGLLSRLNDLRAKLLARASEALREPRELPPRRPPVLELVTRILEEATRPMHAAELHAAACALYGTPIRWASVRQALSANTIGGDHRFRRVAAGIYELSDR
jgi:hypothetical protein